MLRLLFSLLIPLFSYSSLFAQNAIYSIDFNSNWNSTLHPTDFPTVASFSPFIGTTHNLNVNFLEVGQVASNGVESVAEEGRITILSAEINTAIINGNALAIITYDGGAASSTISVQNVNVDVNFPYITLMTMLAPSPDWIAQVHNLKLTDISGSWKTSISVGVYATDAGTDNGSTYASPNSDTNPRGNISSLENISPFSNQFVGTFVFTLESVLDIGELEFEKYIRLYPNPSKGAVVIKSLGNSSIKRVEIYSIVGKKIKTINNKINQNNIEIKALKRGVYFLKLYSDVGATTTKKLIIE